MTSFIRLKSGIGSFFRVVRAVLLVTILSFIIGFCMINSDIVSFKLPLLPYIVYMPLCLVIFISPIILKILRIVLSLLIK